MLLNSPEMCFNRTCSNQTNVSYEHLEICFLGMKAWSWFSIVWGNEETWKIKKESLPVGLILFLILDDILNTLVILFYLWRFWESYSAKKPFKQKDSCINRSFTSYLFLLSETRHWYVCIYTSGLICMYIYKNEHHQWCSFGCHARMQSNIMMSLSYGALDGVS